MDPLLRLHYLETAGITQYVARTRLPGAKPSPVLEWMPIVVTPEQEAVSLAEKTSPAIAVTSAAFSTDAPRINHAAIPVRSTASLYPDPSAQRAVTNKTLTGKPFQCQIAFWSVNDLLVLADMPRLDNAQLALLNDILFAIKRDKVTTPEVFQWPAGKIPDTSLHAARDYFQGLLEAGLLQKNHVRQILVLGDISLQLLQPTTHTEQEALSGRFHDWPLVILPALNAMIETPANKATAWKQLLPLVSVT